MVELAAFAIAVSLPLAVWALVSGRAPAHAEVVGNLTLGMSPEAAQDTVRRRSGRFGGSMRRVHPASITQRLERLLALAGRPPRWTVERVLIVKMVLSVALSAFGLMLVANAPSVGRIVTWALLTVAGYMIPELIIHGRGAERQKVIQKEIPDTLDQMTISVEAGLGFDAAMSRAASNGTGPLADELVRTLQDIQVGVPRRDAYRALADRTTVTDLRRFVAALLQADMYGIPLVDILRTQAQEIRLKRRQRAERQAMQIPVKVVFPLVLFILPTLFIVLLGPAAIDIAAAFGGVN